ncbi:hypothetical protein SANTM175S_01718 [Streptomyces antimycoticus]
MGVCAPAARPRSAPGSGGNGTSTVSGAASPASAAAFSETRSSWTAARNPAVSRATLSLSSSPPMTAKPAGTVCEGICEDAVEGSFEGGATGAQSMRNSDSWRSEAVAPASRSTSNAPVSQRVHRRDERARLIGRHHPRRRPRSAPATRGGLGAGRGRLPQPGCARWCR